MTVITHIMAVACKYTAAMERNKNQAATLQCLKASYFTAPELMEKLM